MRFQLVYTRTAIRNLQRIYDYVAREASVERAESFERRIRDRCEGVCLAPMQGTRREDLAPEVRLIGLQKIVTILFRVEASTVRILSISYRGRLFDADLRS